MGGSIPARAGEPSAPSGRPPSSRVYPRTGGGTRPDGCKRPPCGGLSPHGRGNHGGVQLRGSPQGSIPARAGEPVPLGRSEEAAGVYPRTGGGTAAAATSTAAQGGLSPHGRGNHGIAWGGVGADGSIPARAGEPPAAPKCGSPYRVYPRTGGGTEATFIVQSEESGLSPHGRGNRGENVPVGHCEFGGSIPARAGEPRKLPVEQSHVRMEVYPRTGGGTDWPPGAGCGRPRWRSIPARAGEPWPPGAGRAARRVYPRTGGGTAVLDPDPGAGRAARRVYPRTGGGTAVLDPDQGEEPGLSPHGRGNRGQVRPDADATGSIPARAGEPGGVHHLGAAGGSIPARAGEPTKAGQRPYLLKVYPRTGGGTIGVAFKTALARGLSPHGRGNHMVEVRRKYYLRSIPARAGEPR